MLMIETIVETGLSIARRAEELARSIRLMIVSGRLDDLDIRCLLREVEGLADMSMVINQAVRLLDSSRDLRPEMFRHLPDNVTLH
jgi:hypothetical protein